MSINATNSNHNQDIASILRAQQRHLHTPSEPTFDPDKYDPKIMELLKLVPYNDFDILNRCAYKGHSGNAKHISKILVENNLPWKVVPTENNEVESFFGGTWKVTLLQHTFNGKYLVLTEGTSSVRNVNMWVPHHLDIPTTCIKNYIRHLENLQAKFGPIDYGISHSEACHLFAKALESNGFSKMVGLGYNPHNPIESDRMLYVGTPDDSVSRPPLNFKTHLIFTIPGTSGHGVAALKDYDGNWQQLLHYRIPGENTKPSSSSSSSTSVNFTPKGDLPAPPAANSAKPTPTVVCSAKTERPLFPNPAGTREIPFSITANSSGPPGVSVSIGVSMGPGGGQVSGNANINPGGSRAGGGNGGGPGGGTDIDPKTLWIDLKNFILFRSSRQTQAKKVFHKIDTKNEHWTTKLTTFFNGCSDLHRWMTKLETINDPAARETFLTGMLSEFEGLRNKAKAAMNAGFDLKDKTGHTALKEYKDDRLLNNQSKSAISELNTEVKNNLRSYFDIPHTIELDRKNIPQAGFLTKIDTLETQLKAQKEVLDRFIKAKKDMDAGYSALVASARAYQKGIVVHIGKLLNDPSSVESPSIPNTELLAKEKELQENLTKVRSFKEEGITADLSSVEKKMAAGMDHCNNIQNWASRFILKYRLFLESEKLLNKQIYVDPNADELAFKTDCNVEESKKALKILNERYFDFTNEIKRADAAGTGLDIIDYKSIHANIAKRVACSNYDLVLGAISTNQKASSDYRGYVASSNAFRSKVIAALKTAFSDPSEASLALDEIEKETDLAEKQTTLEGTIAKAKTIRAANFTMETSLVEEDVSARTAKKELLVAGARKYVSTSKQFKKVFDEFETLVYVDPSADDKILNQTYDFNEAKKKLAELKTAKANLEDDYKSLVDSCEGNEQVNPVGVKILLPITFEKAYLVVARGLASDLRFSEAEEMLTGLHGAEQVRADIAFTKYRINALALEIVRTLFSEPARNYIRRNIHDRPTGDIVAFIFRAVHAAATIGAHPLLLQHWMPRLMATGLLPQFMSATNTEGLLGRIKLEEERNPTSNFAGVLGLTSLVTSLCITPVIDSSYFRTAHSNMRQAARVMIGGISLTQHGHALYPLAQMSVNGVALVVNTAKNMRTGISLANGVVPLLTNLRTGSLGLSLANGVLPSLNGASSILSLLAQIQTLHSQFGTINRIPKRFFATHALIDSALSSRVAYVLAVAGVAEKFSDITDGLMRHLNRSRAPSFKLALPLVITGVATAIFAFVYRENRSVRFIEDVDNRSNEATSLEKRKEVLTAAKRESRQIWCIDSALVNKYIFYQELAPYFLKCLEHLQDLTLEKIVVSRINNNDDLNDDAKSRCKQAIEMLDAMLAYLDQNSEVQDKKWKMGQEYLLSEKIIFTIALSNYDEALKLTNKLENGRPEFQELIAKKQGRWNILGFGNPISYKKDKKALIDALLEMMQSTINELVNHSGWAGIYPEKMGFVIKRLRFDQVNLFIAAGDVASAEKLFSSFPSDDVDVLMRRADLALRQKKPKSALQFLEKARASYIVLWENAAQMDIPILESKYLFGLSEETRSQSQKIDNGYSEAILDIDVNRASIFINNGKFDKAIAILSQHSSNEPKILRCFAAIALQKGHFYERLKYLNRAKECYANRLKTAEESSEKLIKDIITQIDEEFAQSKSIEHEIARDFQEEMCSLVKEMVSNHSLLRAQGRFGTSEEEKLYLKKIEEFLTSNILSQSKIINPPTLRSIMNLVIEAYNREVRIQMNSVDEFAGFLNSTSHEIWQANHRVGSLMTN